MDLGFGGRNRENYDSLSRGNQLLNDKEKGDNIFSRETNKDDPDVEDELQKFNQVYHDPNADIDDDLMNEATKDARKIERFTNIFLIGKKYSYLATECVELLHQIALKLDETEISSFIRDLDDFADFMGHGSSVSTEILESSFQTIEKIKFPSEEEA